MGSQLAILYTIKEIGALFFATVMTTRQLISIILSCIIYLHNISVNQWASAAAVFATLYWKNFSKSRVHAKKQDAQKPDETHDEEAPEPPTKGEPTDVVIEPKNVANP